MNFPDGLFGDAWTYGAILPYALLLLWAIRTADWRRLNDSSQLNIWLGSIVVLSLVWSMKAGVKPGLDIHLLGASAFTLMFGRQLALIGLSLVLVAVGLNGWINGVSAWQAFALNALLLAALPVGLTHLILRAVESRLPPNLFIYLFVAAFFGSALCVVTVGLAASLLLSMAGIYSLDSLMQEHFPFYMLLGFAEGWLNGAAITLMVVYYPKWVGSFDDRRYLWQRNKGTPS